jgi:hypothetical protein
MIGYYLIAYYAFYKDEFSSAHRYLVAAQVAAMQSIS